MSALKKTLATGLTVFTLAAVVSPANAEPVDSEISVTEQFYSETGKYAPETSAENERYAELEAVTGAAASTGGVCDISQTDNHPFSTRAFTSKDVLIIGDSQLWPGNNAWSATGIQQAGYTVDGRICALGGIGFANTENSYYNGIVRGDWNLNRISGKPGAILIIGSGNDWDKQDQTLKNAKEVVTKLKQMYPGTPIILTDPISAKPGEATGGIYTDGDGSARIEVGKKLMQFARENDVTFISTRYWASDYGASQSWSNYRDARHFNQNGHNIIAPHFKDSFIQALKGYTLKGGIGGYSADQGGTARFGVPVSNEMQTIDGGWKQEFSNSYGIYWSHQTSSAPVKYSGGLGHKFISDGAEAVYGYPRASEFKSVDGGWVQNFSREYSLYWAPQTGGYAVKYSGALGQRYAQLGYEMNLGYPSEDEQGYAYGYRQIFNKNGKQNRMYWAPNTGAYVMNGGGAIFNKWVNLGHANSLGFPLTDEISESGAIVQYFRDRAGKETGIWWHPRYGTHSMNSKGGIYWAWRHDGGYRTLGYPTSDEISHADGSFTVSFSSGVTLKWTANGGIQKIR